MKRLAEIFIGAIVNLALCQAASADSVFTRDGRIHHGQIFLGLNATVRVVAPGSTNVVTATNLLRVVFGSAAYNPGFPDATAKLYPGLRKTSAPAWQTTDKAIPTTGVMTRNGSFLPGSVSKVDDARIFFAKAKLSRLNASALFLKSLTLAEANRLHGKPAGVLLLNGDFVHGELRALDKGAVTINSIQFGLRIYEAGKEAIAVMLKPAGKAGPRHRFKLRDGSQIFTANYKIKDKNIILPHREISWTRLAEMTVGVQPNLLQAAASHWEALPAALRQTFLTDDRNKTTLARQYGEWSERLKTAGKIMATASGQLPLRAGAEKDAQAAQQKAKTQKESAQRDSAARAQAHVRAESTLANARSQLESQCHNTAQSWQALVTLTSTLQEPARRSLAWAQRQVLAVAEAQAINRRDLAGAEAAVARATAARLAAEAAARNTALIIASTKNKVATAQRALADADRNLQAKQRNLLNARTRLTNGLTGQLRPALNRLATADLSLAQIRAAQKPKAELARATARRVQAKNAFQSAQTAVVRLVQAVNMADKAEQEAEAKARAGRIIFLKLTEDLATHEAQATAWRGRSARIQAHVNQLIEQRQTPARQLATRLATESTRAISARGAAERASAAANAAVIAQELAWRRAIEAGLALDLSELKAQQTEAMAWRELTLARQELARAEDAEVESIKEFREKKMATDAVRAKLAKARGEASLAKAQLTRLKPAFDAIVRP